MGQEEGCCVGLPDGGELGKREGCLDGCDVGCCVGVYKAPGVPHDKVLGVEQS